MMANPEEKLSFGRAISNNSVPEFWKIATKPCQKHRPSRSTEKN
jgi:hypothetical protein